jgi:putative acetyltransferase
MVVGPDHMRVMRPEEEAEVDALLRVAFPGLEEAELVRALRADGAMLAEIVTPWEDRIGAYAGISRMVAPEGWFALAPVAVLPEWQNGVLGIRDGDESLRHFYRFGTRLVRMLAEMFNGSVVPNLFRQSDGSPTLVVLGKPSFYARCGFSSERAAQLVSDYPVDHLLIARAGNDSPEETLVYPAAFDGV